MNKKIEASVQNLAIWIDLRSTEVINLTIVLHFRFFHLNFLATSPK